MSRVGDGVGVLGAPEALLGRGILVGVDSARSPGGSGRRVATHHVVDLLHPPTNAAKYQRHTE